MLDQLDNNKIHLSLPRAFPLVTITKVNEKINYFIDISARQLLKYLTAPKYKGEENTKSMCHKFSFKMQNSTENSTGLFIINKKLSTDSRQQQTSQACKFI